MLPHREDTVIGSVIEGRLSTLGKPRWQKYPMCPSILYLTSKYKLSLFSGVAIKMIRPILLPFRFLVLLKVFPDVFCELIVRQHTPRSTSHAFGCGYSQAIRFICCRCNRELGCVVRSAVTRRDTVYGMDSRAFLRYISY